MYYFNSGLGEQRNWFGEFGFCFFFFFNFTLRIVTHMTEQMEHISETLRLLVVVLVLKRLLT